MVVSMELAEFQSVGVYPCPWFGTRDKDSVESVILQAKIQKNRGFFGIFVDFMEIRGGILVGGGVSTRLPSHRVS